MVMVMVMGMGMGMGRVGGMVRRGGLRGVVGWW